MRDVKVLMQGVARVQEVAFVYVAAYVCFVVLWARERSLRRFARLAMVAGLVTCGLLGFAAFSMLVGFEQLFLQFHLLSFSNDLWQLNPATDRLIQMFPLGFWFQVSLAIGVFTILEGAAIAFAGYYYLRRAGRRPWRRGFGALEGTMDPAPAR
jgi:integral membrane protein (TIGR01906 family)